MPDATIAVSAGAGTLLHTNTRTVSAATVHSEYVLPAEPALPSYIVSPAAAVTCANAGDDIAQLMAGASLNVRIRRIRVEQSALITAAAGALFQIARVTTAGTAGTAVTPSKMDNGDAASGATAASGVPTATKGTIGAQFFQRQFLAVQTAPAGGVATPYWEWTATPGTKPIIIPAGATNGLVIRNSAAKAGLTVMFEIEFTETAWL